MSIKNALFAAAILASIAAPAHAFGIKNLSSEPKTITLEQLGNTQEITLRPGQYYTRTGVGIIIHRGEGKLPVNAHPFGIYSIWPNGDIHIQRYEKVQIGNK
ncbi:MAG: hypothetical protein FJX23_10465 [Alphaproteobacteria bacterium]|nr:hypothetical protein [Alphaproteobacteria bacterium]